MGSSKNSHEILTTETSNTETKTIKKVQTKVANHKTFKESLLELSGNPLPLVLSLFLNDKLEVLHFNYNL